MCNDHKPLQKFLNGKNANNKINRWSLKLASYNITFEWILGAHNKAADCLAQLVDVKDTQGTSTASINMLFTSTTEGPAPTLAARHVTLQIPHHLQMIKPHQTLTRSMHLYLSWQITRILFDKCRRQVPSTNTFQNSSSMTKHLPMKLTLLHTLNVFFTNMLWT